MLSLYDNRSFISVPTSVSTHAKKLIAVVLAVLMAMTTVFMTASMTVDKADADLIKWILCSWGAPSDSSDDKESNDNGEFAGLRPALFYQLTQTEDLQHFLYSRSEASAEYGSVESNVANIVSGKDYASATLDIVNNKNQTEKKYTPYDLFGFAGLKWSIYMGEWNWIKVYYCGSDGKGGDPKDPEDFKINLYYDKRNRPLDTWTDRASSQDPRVRLTAGSERTSTALTKNMGNNIANIIFWITKLIVAFNNMLIEKSMSNVAKDIGFDKITESIMTNLFNGLFVPLLALMMGMTGVWMIGVGILQRKTRQALTALAKTCVIAILGFFMLANPNFFVNLPNDAGMFLQYLVMSATASSVENGKTDDMCSIDAETIKISTIDDQSLFSDGKVNASGINEALSRFGSDVGRNVSCQYWKVFAFLPWTLGQYGTDYHNLFAKGKAEGDNHDIGYSFVRNAEGTQDDWTGLAAVPLGNNQVYFNWAIYQLSAQTDAHISSKMADANTGAITNDKQVDSLLQLAQSNRIIDSTMGDWWRVADAVSGWDTVSRTEEAATGGSSDDSSSTDKGIDGALSWAQKTAQDPKHGYDQTNRNGPDYDCSSFVATALKNAGFNVSIFNTGNEREELKKAGFKKVEGANLKTGEGLKNGDILWVEDSGHKHTEFYTGNGNTIGAHHNERKCNGQKGCSTVTGGQTGDQGNEIGPGKLTDVPYMEAWRVGDGSTSSDVDVSISSSGSDGISRYTQKAGAEKTDWWNTWIGGLSFERQTIAFISIIACLGLIAPIGLGMTILVASIASIVLMAFAPMVLLLSLFPGKGDQLLFEWLKILWSTISKRAVIGLVYMFTLIVIVRLMSGITSINDYMKSVMLMILISIAIYRSKDKIIKLIMRSAGLSARNPVGDKMEAIGNKMNRMKNAAIMGGAAGAVKHRTPKIDTTTGKIMTDSNGKPIMEWKRLREGTKYDKFGNAKTRKQKYRDANGKIQTQEVEKQYTLFDSIMAGAWSGAKREAQNQAHTTMLGRSYLSSKGLQEDLNKRYQLKKLGYTDKEIEDKMSQSGMSSPFARNRSNYSICNCIYHDYIDHEKDEVRANVAQPIDTMMMTHDGYVCQECYDTFYTGSYLDEAKVRMIVKP